MRLPSLLLHFLVVGMVSAQDAIPIYACVSIPGGAFSTHARYQELADAGFTTSLSGFDSLAQAVAALDAAQGTGVKIWVQTPELRSDPALAVRRLRDHPSFAGYHLSDEPSAAAFDELGAWVRTIQALDVTKPCYVNLLPIYASPSLMGTATYVEYIDQFISKVPVPILSFDHYPTAWGVLDQGLYTNLEIFAAAARAADRPFWAFYQSTLYEATQPARTLAALRLESFSNLVYGAQCIQAYTYWQTFGDDRDAPIDRAGNRTVGYDLVQAINREIRGLSHIFAGAMVESVTHAGSFVPPGTQAFSPRGAVSGLDVGSGGAVVSFLTNGGIEYLALVNKDIHAPLALTIDFADRSSVVEIRKDGSERALISSQVTLEPGDVVIFRISATPGNVAPTVNLAIATHGIAGVVIPMSAEAADRDGSVVQVEFFVGAVSVGTDATPPYEATWTPSPGIGYQVTAVATDNSGASTVSTARRVDVVPADAPPTSWSTQDIGPTAAPGATTENDGTWTLTSAAGDLWGNADRFHFAWIPISGDVSLRARVVGMTSANPWAKAGVMIRESTAPGSRHVSTLMTAGNGLCCQRRTAINGPSRHTAGPRNPPPAWVQIERVGNLVTCSTSIDGSTWIEIRRLTVAMGTSVLVGLAVSSHDPGQTCTATFSEVDLSHALPVTN